MFYEEKEISELIICKCCRNVFNDPRILQCGESLCYRCIQLLTIKDANKINCPLCNDEHEIPKTGFTKNNGLAKLIEKKPNEVFRSKMVSDFKTQLNTIFEKTKLIEIDLKIGKEKIKEYCDIVRNNVALFTENVYKHIDKYHHEFMDKIDVYEFNCTRQFDQVYQDRDELDKYLADTKTFCAEWSSYLKKFEIDENQLTNAANMAREHILNLEKEEKKLKITAFNGKLLKFEENSNPIESTLLGKIKYQNIQYNFDQFNQIKGLCLKEQLNEFCYGRKIKIESLSNGYFVIAYQCAEKNVNLLVIDRLGVVLSQKCNLIANADFYWLDNMNLMKINNTIYLYLNYYFYDGTKSFELKSYDMSLNRKKEINLRNDSNLFCAFEANLFNLSNHSGTCMISIYDSKLQVTKNIGQNNCVLPYFFPPTVIKLQVNEQYFFLLDNKEVKLMSRNNGIITRSFKILTNDFTLYSERYILSFDAELKKLCSYNFYGVLISEDVLEKMSSDIELVAVSNKDLIFFDHNQISLYF